MGVGPACGCGYKYPMLAVSCVNFPLKGWGFPSGVWCHPADSESPTPEVCLLETPKGLSGTHSCSPGREGHADARGLPEAWATLLRTE